MTVLEVFVAATLTAMATGLGVVPFFFKRLSTNLVGWANAAAVGLMLAASFQLIIDGMAYNVVGTIGGAVTGYAAMIGIGRLLRRYPMEEMVRWGELNSKRAILIVVVMTLHSFSEGIGVGVSYGGGTNLGLFLTAVIAIHNIPEGLAIALILIPRGVSLAMATVWAVVSSLPQPLMAVPSYLFVSFFAAVLPVGLGFAAGAMTWMVRSEIVPETLKTLSWTKMTGVIVFTLAMAAPLQYLL